MQDVVVAVDPAKRSHTVEVLDHRERVLATLRIETAERTTLPTRMRPASLRCVIGTWSR